MTIQVLDYHQHIFELEFQVATLQTSLYKSVDGSSEKPLGNLFLGEFGLSLAVAKYDMSVHVGLK